MFLRKLDYHTPSRQRPAWTAPQRAQFVLPLLIVAHLGVLVSLKALTQPHLQLDNIGEVLLGLGLLGLSILICVLSVLMLPYRETFAGLTIGKWVYAIVRAF